MSQQLKLFVPDRYDVLQREIHVSKDFIHPVQDSLHWLDAVHKDISAARRGGFRILHGTSGSGKSTFLQTLHLFRQDVESMALDPQPSISDALAQLEAPTTNLRIIELSGRESLTDTTHQQIETTLHSINTFLRSPSGERTLIVWPSNTDNLAKTLAKVGHTIGADALLGLGEPINRFTGPPPDKYIDIAERTIQAANNGATFYDLGISAEHAAKLQTQADTIGHFLAHIRDALLQNTRHVEELLVNEQCRVWIVVLAKDAKAPLAVASLTRGSYSNADVERMMHATQANIVSDIKRHPAELGILGTVLDVKIIHMPITTVLSLVRTFANDALRTRMAEHKMSTRHDHNVAQRLEDSQLAHALLHKPIGPQTRGRKPGETSQDAFSKLLQIARTNDVLLNTAIATALTRSSLVDEFTTERKLDAPITLKSDIALYKNDDTIRLEMMWRDTATSAIIANYALTKIANYAHAVGLLDTTSTS